MTDASLVSPTLGKGATDSASVGLMYAQALQHLQAGRLTKAERVYRQILATEPAHPDSLHLLGVIAYRQGDGQTGCALVTRAIGIDDSVARYHHNLGNMLRAGGRLAEAAQCYRRALHLAPDLVDARHSLACTLQELGYPVEAILRYHDSLVFRPNLAVAHYNLGTALQGLDRLTDAMTEYQRSVDIDPGLASSHHNLGLILQEQERWDQAAICYRRALSADPGQIRALGPLVAMRQMCCDWTDAKIDEAKLLEYVRADQGECAPFVLLSLTATPEDQLRCARRWTRFRTEGTTALPVRPGRGDDGKIRLGYLSADFHEHATGYLAVELFERHDRSRFKVTAYSLRNGSGGPLRHRLEHAFDRFVELSELSHTAAAQVIRDDGIDILIDLKGHTQHARPQILAAHPAPIQVNFLGYPGTMGADFIDYIIADSFVAPLDQQPFFSEKIVHLPGCYQPNDSQRKIAETIPSRAQCGLPEAAFVFCCFNHSFKLTPELFDIWMRLLRAVPGSVLWLLDANRTATDNLRREAEVRGVTADRLVFAPRLPLAEHLARHRLADLFLDTLPCGAHTTASDALWAGLPLLTCAGATFAGRVAGSLLNAVGLPELVVESLADYEAAALCLATEPARLAGLRQRLAANRLIAPLFDGAAFARHIEAAYTTMWQCRCDGLHPQAFQIAPIAPAPIDDLLAKAFQHHQSDRLDQAAQLYRQILAIAPDHSDCLHLLGALAHQRGDHQGARHLITRAIAIRDNLAAYHGNLGTVLLAEDKPDEAVAAFQRALALAPCLPRAHYNLGSAYRTLGLSTEAAASFGAALAVEPAFAEAHDFLGLVLREQGLVTEAQWHHRYALTLAPGLASAHHNLAITLREQDKVGEAAEHFERALIVTPEDGETLCHLVAARQMGCDWRGAAPNQARLLELVRQDRVDAEPFFLLSLDSTPADQLSCARRLAEASRREATPLPPPSRQSRGKIRVGYLSADFQAHATTVLAIDLFERHDRARFTVAAYSLGRNDDSPFRRRVEQAFDSFSDLADLSHDAAAKAIRADGVDILVDLMGYTNRARPQIVAARAAPVQVSFLGYPGTMGADFVDYIIGDRYVLPMDQQPFFTERIVHLPHCYQPSDSRRRSDEAIPSRTACGLPDRGFVFCCFNNAYKITPQVFDVWMRLLAAVPDSVLWLSQANTFMAANLVAEAEQRAIKAERLVFAGKVPLPVYLARLSLADLFLDTLPYNAGATANDALWAGLPILTCCGDTYVGRMAGSLLHAVGLPELVTTTLSEYEALARRLATDPALLNGFRRRLAANKVTAPLFDGAAFTRHIETAYTTMWQCWLDDRPPQAFAVDG